MQVLTPQETEQVSGGEVGHTGGGDNLSYTGKSNWFEEKLNDFLFNWSRL